MIYIYKDLKNRYIVSDKEIPDLALILLFPWDSLDPDNIRPWKHLGLGTDLYKPGLLKYLEDWKDSVMAPPKNPLKYAYKKDIEKVLGDYKEILNLLYSLELIDKPKETKYMKFMTYECDVANYLEDVFGTYIIELCEKYKELGEEKKKFLKKLAELQGRENKLALLRSVEIDLDLFTFLPPWFKLNYQVFGSLERIVRNQNIDLPEHDKQERVDGYAGEELLEEHVYEIFKYGEILSSKEIKERLTELYQKLGIKRIAKVTDLFNYFDLVRTYSRMYKLWRRRVD